MSSWLSMNNALNIFDIFKWTSIPTFSIMSGTVFVIFSTICWVFMSKSEMPSYPQRRLSGFYNSMMKVRKHLRPIYWIWNRSSSSKFSHFTRLQQPDEDISETDEDMSITELMKSFDEILKLEIEELSEHVPQRNRRSSWYLLKVISRKLKTDPNSIIEAAQMNLHILTLNFVIQLLPTAESNVRENLLTFPDYQLNTIHWSLVPLFVLHLQLFSQIAYSKMHLSHYSYTVMPFLIVEYPILNSH